MHNAVKFLSIYHFAGDTNLLNFSKSAKQLEVSVLTSISNSSYIGFPVGKIAEKQSVGGIFDNMALVI